jgi:hypothetical protein
LLIDGLVCAYLSLPLVIFCAWFKWPAALVLGGLVVFGFAQALHGLKSRPIDLSPKLIASLGVISVVCTAVAGVGHLFYANDDWIIRDAVLRDLVATSWPPKYNVGGESALILRAPVAYFLPAAVVGACFDLRLGDLALFAWTALGLCLFLSAASSLFPSTGQRWACVFVLIGFGGLDVVGILLRSVLTNTALPGIGEHIEWWARFAQYSSNTTLLFWVPNHALPAWLGIVLIVRHWRRPELARISPLLAAAVPLWSPFAAIGLAPFVVAGLNWRRDYRHLFSTRSGVPLLGIALIEFRFMTMDSQSIPGSWAVTGFSSVLKFLAVYLAFAILEFGALAFILRLVNGYDLRLVIAVLMLIILPLYSFGPWNDLAMRGSIPALTILALAAVRALADQNHQIWRALLTCVLLIGALGAVQEPLRTLGLQKWPLKSQTLDQAVNNGLHTYGSNLPPHYVAHLNRPELITLMREPSLVQPDNVKAPAVAP